MLSIGSQSYYRICCRLAALKRFIEYVKSHDKVWLATREQIARHWLELHPKDAVTSRVRSYSTPTIFEIQ